MSYAATQNQELSKITINSLKDTDMISSFEDSYAQLVTYVSTAIKQEIDFTNEMLNASQSNEDQTNIKRIL